MYADLSCSHLLVADDEEEVVALGLRLEHLLRQRVRARVHVHEEARLMHEGAYFLCVRQVIRRHGDDHALTWRQPEWPLAA